MRLASTNAFSFLAVQGQLIGVLISGHLNRARAAQPEHTDSAVQSSTRMPEKEREREKEKEREREREREREPARD